MVSSNSTKDRLFSKKKQRGNKTLRVQLNYGSIPLHSVLHRGEGALQVGVADHQRVLVSHLYLHGVHGPLASGADLDSRSRRPRRLGLWRDVVGAEAGDRRRMGGGGRRGRLVRRRDLEVSDAGGAEIIRQEAGDGALQRLAEIIRRLMVDRRLRLLLLLELLPHEQELSPVLLKEESLLTLLPLPLPLLLHRTAVTVVGLRHLSCFSFPARVLTRGNIYIEKGLGNCRGRSNGWDDEVWDRTGEI